MNRVDDVVAMESIAADRRCDKHDPHGSLPYKWNQSIPDFFRVGFVTFQFAL
jgi:hypothetical protein